MMDVCFCLFFNSFVTCNKKIWYIFFNIVCRTESLWHQFVLFVALSHCYKQIVCLWHLVTVTIFFRSSQKDAKKANNAAFFGSFPPFQIILSVFLLLHFLCITYFGIFFSTYTSFVVAVTQCNKQNKSLSQWLSATNNIKKKSNFFVACDKRIRKKPENKHPFKFEFHHR